MALGLLLWVSWITFLVFDSSAGSSVIQGYAKKIDARNIGDDEEDEMLTFDLSDLQASNNQPTVSAYTSNNNPSVAQWPHLVPSRQNQPNRHGVPEAGRLVNGGPREWGLGNLEKPLMFPLSPVYQPNDPAKPQPGPALPQSLSVASTNRMPDSPAGGSSLYQSLPAHSEPALPYQAANSPSFESVSSGHSVSGHPNQDPNRGGSGNNPHLVYEEVFEYPNENTGPSSNTAGQHSQPNYRGKGSTSRRGGPSFPSFPTKLSTKFAFPSGKKILELLPKPAIKTTKTELTQRVRKPILPPPPPSSYIVQSRNGYQRARYILSHSKYSPEFPSPMPANLKGVKGQPAAPKGVKNPQWTKW